MFKFKTVKLFNIEAEDMKIVGYGLMALAFAIVVLATSNAYVASKGVNINNNFEVNIVKEADKK
ncbi:hypothetical protein D3C78_1251650 [compost metagenome]